MVALLWGACSEHGFRGDVAMTEHDATRHRDRFLQTSVARLDVLFVTYTLADPTL